VLPEAAEIRMDGLLMRRGSLDDSVNAGAHTFLFRHDGYRDSVLALDLPSRATTEADIRLSPRTGSLRVETLPRGARIEVNGVDRGPAPVIVAGLEVPSAHTVRAVLAGYEPVERMLAVFPDSLLTEVVSLAERTVPVSIFTEPVSGVVSLDGVELGLSPQRVPAITLGKHRFRARADGYRETEVERMVTEETRIVLQLETEPPGYLLLVGDQPARMKVDGNYVISYPTYRSDLEEVRGGLHTVEVELTSGERVVREIEIRPGYRVVFNYSRNDIVENVEHVP
jgi:hypothetical protein